jgi:hypothetical protein
VALIAISLILHRAARQRANIRAAPAVNEQRHFDVTGVSEMTRTQVRNPSLLLLLLAAGVVPAAGLLGVLGAAPVAHATADDAFLSALTAKGINYESPETAIRSGHLVCQELESGKSPQQVANDVMTNSHLDGYHAGYFVGVSIRAYCPKYQA